MVAACLACSPLLNLLMIESEGKAAGGRGLVGWTSFSGELEEL